MLARPSRNYDAFHRKREHLRPAAAATGCGLSAFGDVQRRLRETVATAWLDPCTIGYSKAGHHDKSQLSAVGVVSQQ